jgi:GNAT superfamily N-acetyltransferase
MLVAVSTLRILNTDKWITTMDIYICETDEQITACEPVMRELRPHIPSDQFVRRIRQQEVDGYRLVGLNDGSRPVAAAGIRILLNLAWGKFLYVDDLVTLDAERSSGYGAALLRWLHDHARQQNCDELHLDSGTQRKAAHRFYDREGMEMTSYHYTTRLRDGR